MGRVPSDRPRKLPGKLLSIRRSLGLSQGGMVGRLGLRYKLTREDISKYERGVRPPALLTLLAYARAGRTTVDWLIDDNAALDAPPVATRDRPPDDMPLPPRPR